MKALDDRKAAGILLKNHALLVVKSSPNFSRSLLVNGIFSDLISANKSGSNPPTASPFSALRA